MHSLTFNPKPVAIEVDQGNYTISNVAESVRHNSITFSTVARCMEGDCICQHLKSQRHIIIPVTKVKVGA